ncbi:MAG: DUF2304 domain-containing protein [Anaerocolumna sp.]
MLTAVYLTIALVGVFLICIILRFLVKKKLNESNAILWICIGIVIILSGSFPGIIVKLSNLFLITYPPAFIFTVAIIILLLIVLKNTIINSELSAKMQETAMEASILRQELYETKKKLEFLQLQIDKVEQNRGESY